MGDFPDSVIQEAWNRAGGRCECRRKNHVHLPYGRCNKQLNWDNRGRKKEALGAWEAHHTISQEENGQSILSNCEVLCWNCFSSIEFQKES